MEEILHLMRDYASRHNLIGVILRLFDDESGRIFDEEYNLGEEHTELFDFGTIEELKEKLKR